MAIIILIALAFIIFFVWLIKKFTEGVKNAKMEANQYHFKQGGVTVDFATGRITIKNYTYHVNQVTGISAEPFTSNRHGDSRAWQAIILVDDFHHPIHKISFLSSSRAEEFTQRLCVALRKAGGPSFA